MDLQEEKELLKYKAKLKEKEIDNWGCSMIFACFIICFILSIFKIATK